MYSIESIVQMGEHGLQCKVLIKARRVLCKCSPVSLFWRGNLESTSLIQTEVNLLNAMKPAMRIYFLTGMICRNHITDCKRFHTQNKKAVPHADHQHQHRQLAKYNKLLRQEVSTRAFIFSSLCDTKCITFRESSSSSSGSMNLSTLKLRDLAWIH